MFHKILNNPAESLLILSLGFVTFHAMYRYIVGRGDDLFEKLKWRWTALESVTVTIAAYFWSQLLAAIPLVVLFGEKVIRQETVFIKFVTALVVDVVALGLLYLFLRKRKAGVVDIGLKAPVIARDLGYILAGYVAYVATYVVLIKIVSGLPGFNIDQKQLLDFAPGIHGASLLLVFASLVILPPITEEILMRGFLYSGLRRKFTMVQAGLITSVLFAMAHLQAGSGNALLWIAAIDTFVLSMVLVYLREKTGSLVAPMGLHMLKNLIAFAALFIFKVA